MNSMVSLSKQYGVEENSDVAKWVEDLTNKIGNVALEKVREARKARDENPDADVDVDANVDADWTNKENIDEYNRLRSKIESELKEVQNALNDERIDRETKDRLRANFNKTETEVMRFLTKVGVAERLKSGEHSANAGKSLSERFADDVENAKKTGAALKDKAYTKPYGTDGVEDVKNAMFIGKLHEATISCLRQVRKSKDQKAYSEIKEQFDQEISRVFASKDEVYYNEILRIILVGKLAGKYEENRLKNFEQKALGNADLFVDELLKLRTASGYISNPEMFEQAFEVLYDSHKRGQRLKLEERDLQNGYRKGKGKAAVDRENNNPNRGASKTGLSIRSVTRDSEAPGSSSVGSGSRPAVESSKSEMDYFDETLEMLEEPAAEASQAVDRRDPADIAPTPPAASALTNVSGPGRGQAATPASAGGGKKAPPPRPNVPFLTPAPESSNHKDDVEIVVEEVDKPSEQEQVQYLEDFYEKYQESFNLLNSSNKKSGTSASSLQISSSLPSVKDMKEVERIAEEILNKYKDNASQGADARLHASYAHELVSRYFLNDNLNKLRGQYERNKKQDVSKKQAQDLFNSYSNLFIADHIKNSKELYGKGKASLKAVNLSGCSLANIDCTNVDFELADVTGADFSGAVLNKAEFGIKVKGLKVEQLSKAADLEDIKFTGESVAEKRIVERAEKSKIHIGKKEEWNAIKKAPLALEKLKIEGSAKNFFNEDEEKIQAIITNTGVAEEGGLLSFVVAGDNQFVQSTKEQLKNRLNGVFPDYKGFSAKIEKLPSSKSEAEKESAEYIIIFKQDNISEGKFSKDRIKQIAERRDKEERAKRSQPDNTQELSSIRSERKKQKGKGQNLFEIPAVSEDAAPLPALPLSSPPELADVGAEIPTVPDRDDQDEDVVGLVQPPHNLGLDGRESAFSSSFSGSEERRTSLEDLSEGGQPATNDKRSPPDKHMDFASAFVRAGSDQVKQNLLSQKCDANFSQRYFEVVKALDYDKLAIFSRAYEEYHLLVLGDTQTNTNSASAEFYALYEAQHSENTRYNVYRSSNESRGGNIAKKVRQGKAENAQTPVWKRGVVHREDAAPLPSLPLSPPPDLVSVGGEAPPVPDRDYDDDDDYVEPDNNNLNNGEKRMSNERGFGRGQDQQPSLDQQRQYFCQTFGLNRQDIDDNIRVQIFNAAFPENRRGNNHPVPQAEYGYVVDNMLARRQAIHAVYESFTLVDLEDIAGSAREDYNRDVQNGLIQPQGQVQQGRQPQIQQQLQMPTRIGSGGQQSVPPPPFIPQAQANAHSHPMAHTGSRNSATHPQSQQTDGRPQNAGGGVGAGGGAASVAEGSPPPQGGASTAVNSAVRSPADPLDPPAPEFSPRDEFWRRNREDGVLNAAKERDIANLPLKDKEQASVGMIAGGVGLIALGFIIAIASGGLGALVGVGFIAVGAVLIGSQAMKAQSNRSIERHNSKLIDKVENRYNAQFHELEDIRAQEAADRGETYPRRVTDEEPGKSTSEKKKEVRTSVKNARDEILREMVPNYGTKEKDAMEEALKLADFGSMSKDQRELFKGEMKEKLREANSIYKPLEKQYKVHAAEIVLEKTGGGCGVASDKKAEDYLRKKAEYDGNQIAEMKEGRTDYQQRQQQQGQRPQGQGRNGRD